MKYDFPLIEHIDDIESHRDAELIHAAFKRSARRNGTIVYDYTYMANDVFPAIGATPFAAVARELRGLTFDEKSGALLSRPYQKFFNAGEREETLTAKLPLDHPHVVMEKLDGSMVHAFIGPDGEIAFATRWGVTAQAAQALDFYAAHDGSGAGRAAMRRLIEDGYTPIFEWTTPETIIVVQHREPALTLTGLRHRRSGAFVRHDELHAHARALRTPLVKMFDPVTDWESFATRAAAETEGEGYVLRFDDGHMLKIKNTLYARVHKFKGNLSQPKDAAEIVLDGGLDDMLPYLAPAEQDRLVDYREAMIAALSVQAARIGDAVERARAALGDVEPRERQKQFWTGYAAPLGAGLATCANDVWVGRAEPLEAIIGFARKHTGAGPRFDLLAENFALPKLDFGFEAHDVDRGDDRNDDERAKCA